MALMQLSPRDIQDRLRAGATPESVAEEAGLDLDRIQGFVLPVMREREHIVERALKTRVRRKHVTGTLAPLADVLERAAFHAESWDSWRREDGSWTVEATHASGDRSSFRFDPRGNIVVADSPGATALLGDLAHEQDMAIVETLATPVPITGPVAGTEVDAEVDTDAVDTSEDTSGQHAAPPQSDAIEDALESGRQPLPGMPVPPSSAADHEQTIEISAPVRSLKEARDRRAMEQLTIDLELDAQPGADTNQTDEAPPTTPTTPAAPTKRPSRAVPDTWSEMLFGSND